MFPHALKELNYACILKTGDKKKTTDEQNCTFIEHTHW